MKNKVKKVVTWVLQILLGLEFILAGQAKFTRPDVWAREFRDWGYPDNVHYIIGGLELIGAVLIFFPKFASKAALGLGIIMLGAAVTHLLHQEWSRVVVTLILTGLLSLVYFLRKGNTAD
ncbi:DoxX family membrane protein [Leptobacterium flavescens]|uniref:DoxX family membrane protein n=1 Tax=Leptobacterium flavescens TaxID=472055 RepID=A0A6P0UT89_9FLAO|nr:DoxX family protein [Leptobacterium flavescens]NER13616.1 DoxX family membrane protein [Leptobacterium flavescens]